MEILKIRPVIYVSGPYTEFTKNGEIHKISENAKIAQSYANELRKLNFAVICPHSNIGDPEEVPDELTWSKLLEEDYSIILSCHGMFMLPNWKESEGAKIEHEWAKELNIPIFYWNDDASSHVNPHEWCGIPIDCKNKNYPFSEDFKTIIRFYQNPETVWERCPNQVKEFLKTTNEMFRVHLKKNEDYSPYNILGTGEIGLATRVWDKTSRLMNLVGFDIKTGKHTKPKLPKNESVADNLSDFSVYGIIWQIYRKGFWGN